MQDLSQTDLLASPQALAVRLQLEPSDETLLLALQRASARFIDEVGHPVIKTEDVAYLSGEGGRSLLLPAFPVHGDPTVEIDGVTVTDFDVGRRFGILRRRHGVWPEGLENVRVTYTHGFEEVPGGIQDAVLEQAETIHQTMVFMAARSAGGEAITFSAQATVGVTSRWSDAVARFSRSACEEL